MKTIYKNEDFMFVLEEKDDANVSGARIVRQDTKTGEEVVLFDYDWPAQLTVEVDAAEGTLREDGILCWQLLVTAHHVSGMVQGEFTETEFFEVTAPFGSKEELTCSTVDIAPQASSAPDLSARRRKAGPLRTSVND